VTSGVTTPRRRFEARGAEVTIERMTRTSSALLVVLAASAACTKDQPAQPSGSLGTVTIPAKAPPAPAPAAVPSAKAAPAAITAEASFDERFLALSKTVSPLVLDGGGSALQGNVRQASAPPSGAAAATARDPNAPLPLEPSGDAIGAVVRENLPAVRSCYRLVAKGGNATSGKAIVTFGVAQDGKASDVKVDAPAFADTALPKCVSALVSRWSFPPSQKGGAGFSYPMVFSGA